MMGRHVIDYLRISITDRCNFRCIYCMPREGAECHDHRDLLSFEEIEEFTETAATLGVTRVRITGGEPLVRRNCTGIVEMLARIPGIKDISLTTNGALLVEHADALKSAGLSRLNISIDSLDPERFSHITRGGRLKDSLTGLEAALRAGFDPVKVNAVMLDGIEEDLEPFVRMTRESPVHVRFIEFMPVGRRVGGVWRFVPRRSVMEKLTRFGKLRPVKPPAGGGPARYFRFADAPGTVGFISSMSDHFCWRCNRLRLTADGRLRNCLFSDEEVNVRPFIAGDRHELAGVIRDSMNSKKFDRRLSDPGVRTMSQIGG
jgi:cyclic pyranopterin phosphate synthase